MSRRLGSALLVAVQLSWAPVAIAQDAPPPPTPPVAPQAPAAGALAAPTASSPPSEAAIEEAKQRYRRALELFDEGSFDAALLEMRRAYALAPSYRVLYNLGLIDVQLNDFVAALDFFQRYLSEGGKDIPADRVTEVEQRMEKLRTRIAFVNVETNVPAEISVDDIAVGTTPMTKPLKVNAGKRRISARAQGLVPESRVVEVAGQDNIKVSLNLVDPRVRTIAVHTEPPLPREAWIAWGATALLAGGTAVFGILASNANSSYKEKQNTFGVTSGELAQADHKTARLALTADLLGVATLAAAGVAVYFTVFAPTAASAAPETAPTPAKAAKASLRVGVGAGQVHAVGQF